MLKAKCALCGRPTTPYAMIGNMAVGPKCAARAGIVKGKLPKGTSVRFAVKKTGTSKRSRQPETIDMFLDQDGSIYEPAVL